MSLTYSTDLTLDHNNSMDCSVLKGLSFSVGSEPPLLDNPVIVQHVLSPGHPGHPADSCYFYLLRSMTSQPIMEFPGGREGSAASAIFTPPPRPANRMDGAGRISPHGRVRGCTSVWEVTERADTIGAASQIHTGGVGEGLGEQQKSITVALPPSLAQVFKTYCFSTPLHRSSLWTRSLPQIQSQPQI